MSNRIFAVEISTTRFDPASAELALTVIPETPMPGLELRGRLNGPSCPYAETIEVAYPLRMVHATDDLLRANVIIPEASVWEPTTPFLYRGFVELWHNVERLDRVDVSYGIRQLQLKRQGLRLNGKPLVLRGVGCETLDDVQAARFRASGCNLVMTTAARSAAKVWAAADRLGFFVLGVVDPSNDDALWEAEKDWSRRTSCFGWLLPQSAYAVPQIWHNAMSLLQGQKRNVLIGIKVEDLPLGVLPGHVSFVACEERLLEDLKSLTLPKIVLTRDGYRDLPVGEYGTILGQISKRATFLERDD